MQNVPIKHRLVYFVGCVHFYIEHITLSWERFYHYGLNLPSTRCPHLVCGCTTHPRPLLHPTHWRGRGSARSVHLHHLITNRSGWPQPSLSHIFHDFSSPLPLLMSAQCGWLRMLKMTHSSNVSHLVQQTIIFKVEKVHFHWRLVCGWPGTWQCVYAWAYVCLHVCSP